MISSGLEILVF
ncbi:hypothetical protein YPPY72_1052, partial [Yersinia pestis PY-72]